MIDRKCRTWGEAVRRAHQETTLSVYEEAVLQGASAEGRLKLALDAMRYPDLAMS